MAEWRFDGDDDQEDGDDEEGSFTFFGGRTATIFLIDAAKEMFEAPDGDEEEPPFQRAIRVRGGMLAAVNSICSCISLLLRTSQCAHRYSTVNSYCRTQCN